MEGRGLNRVARKVIGLEGSGAELEQSERRAWTPTRPRRKGRGGK